MVGPDETVRVIAQFTDDHGLSMVHCHNIEHEDAGMMSSFEVVPGPPQSPDGGSRPDDRICP